MNEGHEDDGALFLSSTHSDEPSFSDDELSTLPNPPFTVPSNAVASLPSSAGVPAFDYDMIDIDWDIVKAMAEGTM